MPLPHARPHRHAGCPPCQESGVTLVECAITAAIVAVCVGLALPSFDRLWQRRTVEGLAAQLEADLQFARSEAVARNENMRVGFADDPQGSCYIVHTGASQACQCTGDGHIHCEPGAVAVKVGHLAGGRGVALTSNSSSMLFDNAIGTVTPTATIQVSAPDAQLKVIVNIMGRIRACTPDQSMPGYAAC
jgi:type IV fimbrial biogenesis protein FimT